MHWWTNVHYTWHPACHMGELSNKWETEWMPVGHSLCHQSYMSQVWVPPETAHFLCEKISCFALSCLFATYTPHFLPLPIPLHLLPSYSSSYPCCIPVILATLTPACATALPLGIGLVAAAATRLCLAEVRVGTLPSSWLVGLVCCL